jgi:vitamin B12 transporter
MQWKHGLAVVPWRAAGWSFALGVGGPGAAALDGVEPPLVELPSLRVVGTRLPAGGGGAEAELAGSNDLLAAGYATAGDFLADQAGVFFNPDPGGSGASELFVRGGETNFTVVLVDGVKVNQTMGDRGGTFDLGLLSPVVEGAVVLRRGGGSALMGSGALSGSLAFESLPEGAAPGVRLQWNGAPEAGRGGGFRVREAEGNWLWQGAGGGSESGWAEVGRGERRQWQAALGARGPLGPELSLAVAVRRMEAVVTAFPADSGGWRLAEVRTLERSEHAHTLGSVRLSRSWERGSTLSLRMGGYAHDVETDSPRVAPGPRDPMGLPAITAETALRRGNVALDWSGRLTRQWELGLGAEIERATGETRSVFAFGPVALPADYRIGRTVRSLGLESRWSHERGELFYATRWDDATGEGGHHSQEVRVDWRPLRAAGHSLGLSWRDGFKFPSLYALSNALVGNPELRSEGARTAGAHLRWASPGGGWEVLGTAYRATYTDLVDFDSGPPPRLVNRGRFTVSGFDLEARGHRGPWRWRVHASLARPELPEGAAPLRDRPEWGGGAALGWHPAGRMALDLRARYTGERLGSSIPTGDRLLEAYWLAEGVASWEFAAGWRAGLRVENLLDRAYEHAVGNPGRGRTPWLSLQADF